jgi:hypothetical protein
MKKIIPLIAGFWYGILLLPLISYAQIQGNSGTGGAQGNSGTGGTQGITTWETLKNPLGNVTLQQFFIKLIQILLIFAVPIIVFFIILAGFKYVTARGNTTQIQDATRALTWAIIGGVLILGAEALLYIIQNTVNAIR